MSLFHPWKPFSFLTEKQIPASEDYLELNWEQGVIIDSSKPGSHWAG